MHDDRTSPSDLFFEHLADLDGSDDEGVIAPSRLKSKIYSRLMAHMEQSGPLEDLRLTGSTDRLCVFENLVQIAPLKSKLAALNCCRLCHARVLGERIENAPIYWRHCPYVRFQNR